MVDLVLQGAREEAAGRHDLRQVVYVEVLACNLRSALDGPADPGEAQAPFLVELGPVAGDDLWIEEDKRHLDNGVERCVFVGLAPFRDVDHAHPLRAADLLGREPDALRRMHRRKHVCDELPKRLGDDGNRLRLLAEDRFAVLVDSKFQKLKG